MKYLLITLGLILLGACEFGTPEPTLVPDVPEFSEGEAIALAKSQAVEDFVSLNDAVLLLEGINTDGEAYGDCLSLGIILFENRGSGSGWKEEYKGKGVWQVKFDNSNLGYAEDIAEMQEGHDFRWLVYEKSAVVENIGSDKQTHNQKYMC